MGKFVMDALEYGAFIHEVVHKLPFLKNYAASKSFYDKAIYFANNINLSSEDRVLDVLAVTQSEIISNHGKALPGTSPTMYYSNIMWEYVYILLYYAHYGEQLWTDTILPKMWKMQKNAVIRDEMKKGEQYVDQYINARKELKEKIRSNNIQSESVPDTIQIMQDINKGRIAHTDVDWELQIKTVLKLINLMPTKFPSVFWLWGLLGEIDDINTRIDILHEMQEVANKCFEDVFQARDFREDCNCLIYVYQGSLQYNTKNKYRTSPLLDRR